MDRPGATDDNAPAASEDPNYQDPNAWQPRLPSLNRMVAGVPIFNQPDQSHGQQRQPEHHQYQEQHQYQQQQQPQQPQQQYRFVQSHLSSGARSTNIYQDGTMQPPPPGYAVFHGVQQDMTASHPQYSQPMDSQRNMPPYQSQPRGGYHHQTGPPKAGPSSGIRQTHSMTPPQHPASPMRIGADTPKSQWMPNLLGAHRASALDSMSFSLVVRQQPRAARACGFGDRDRRVIDPPPIVQLVITAPDLAEDEIRTYICFSSYVMNCSIWDETGTKDASALPEEYDQHRRRMTGSLIATPFVGKDETGKEGCFFCFSDLSCRIPGSFRLKFTLIMIEPSRASSVRHFPNLADVLTDVFHVYTAKEFPGMIASSELAKRLREQGCIISIKKGNERGRGGRGRDAGSEEEDE
ncbi:Putative VeA protein [[Torrubiella] hemipterigena]|uniref:Putative VeA protein n=1 Tax=[Torrubiella] hemipterigena TaxID=1531966 RepID=A0A0A1TG06_9HYPO|nr:Putative VeA protein [[Torrubiella] hemipterigena]